MMGSADSDKEASTDEKPRHKVTVKPFSIGRYEVTKAQYAAFVKDTRHPSGDSCWSFTTGEWKEQTGADWRKPGFAQDDQHPAICVNLDDALAYIAWLNDKTGLTYRLPTEAEWEYAARAGTDTARYWGDNPDEACLFANVGDETVKQQIPGWRLDIHHCTDGYAYTAPVGRFKPNAFKLYDMLGNVWEWTCSKYPDKDNSPYDGSEFSCTNDANSRRTVRGGAWNGRPHSVRSAYRDRDNPANRYGNLGFRLAQD